MLRKATFYIMKVNTLIINDLRTTCFEAIRPCYHTWLLSRIFTITS